MTELTQEYWETRWQNGQTGWDIGTTSPALVDYCSRIAREQRAVIRVLIPGCGNGHEAVWLAENGFENVTMLDIAPSAVQNMERAFDQHLSPEVSRPKVICGDFFALEGQYDLILEQTFFCALSPNLRPAYVAKMAELLSPNGRLAGLLFNKPFEGGPPFGGTAGEYQPLFSTHLQILEMEECLLSIPPRKGSEVFFIAQQR